MVKDTFGTQEMAIVMALVVVVVLGGVGAFLIDQTVTVSDLQQGVKASGVLTAASGLVKDGELVNISTFTFEFDTDGSIGAGHIWVNASNTVPGGINQTVALFDLNNAIANNASVTALVTATLT